MLLYHYCSNDTFLSILRNSELWLSELTLSNDSMEGAWLWKVLRAICQANLLSDNIINAITTRPTGKHETKRIAGFCMSGADDVLSQWRAYAANGTGVAIGFDEGALRALMRNANQNGINISLERMIYLGEDAENIFSSDKDKNDQTLYNIFIADVLNKIQKIKSKESSYEQSPTRTICKFGKFNYKYELIVKNSAFSEEKEWRIFMESPDYAIKCTDERQHIHVDFRVCSNHIIPYLSLPFPKKDCIKEIILGPRNHTPEPVIRAALEKFGFPDVTIRRSAATYR